MLLNGGSFVLEGRSLRVFEEIEVRHHWGRVSLLSVSKIIISMSYNLAKTFRRFRFL